MVLLIMARKKRVSRSRRAKASRASSVQTFRNMPIQNRFTLAWKNLILFVVLFVISFILYNASTNSLITNLFGLLSIILGFLALAFFIIWIVLAILKSDKR